MNRVNIVGYLNNDESGRVKEAVSAAEANTSAEIKVVIARHCWGDIKTKAHDLFLKYGLDKTSERNGVMMLLITTNREFLIYGDEGIHTKVEEGFWESVRDIMAAHFRDGDFVGGVCEGVRMVGDILHEYFPRAADDRNELSDEVIHDA